MSIGANLYLQVPDTYSHHDILQWREDFIAAFDFYGGMNPLHIEDSVFSVATLGHPNIPHDGTLESAWEVFPKCFFLELYTRLDYYGPGYERGSIDTLIAIGEWLDNRIPGSVMWYGTDSSGVLLPFTMTVRDVFQEYFELVGGEPYRNKSGDWRDVQAQYHRKLNQVWEDSLNEIKRQYGVK